MKKHTMLVLFLFLLTATVPAADLAEVIGSPEENVYYGIPADVEPMIVRRGFTLGYSGKKRQAVWVSYLLLGSRLEGKQVERSNLFRADPLIVFRPVLPSDYTRTGYDRGHLAPAADMTYSEETMQNSFYMTNISPQIPGCNRGIWKRLEEKVRSFAREKKALFIVTGPVFARPDEKETMMGSTDIPVPVAFYKVIYCTGPPPSMIAFLVPNSPTRKQLKNFVVSVDAVEALTGLDFFSGLDDRLEKELEARSDPSGWDL